MDCGSRCSFKFGLQSTLLFIYFNVAASALRRSLKLTSSKPRCYSIWPAGCSKFFLSVCANTAGLATLCRRISPKQFRFESSHELREPQGILGQDRAVEALEFGLSVRQSGYNLFVLGPPASGRHNIVQQVLEQRAAGEAAPRRRPSLRNAFAARSSLQSARKLCTARGRSAAPSRPRRACLRDQAAAAASSGTTASHAGAAKSASFCSAFAALG